MNKNYAQSQNLINLVIVALVFLMPVFFLPISSEFFEFNKLTLLGLTTAVTLVFWGVRTILTEKLEVARSPLDLPMLAFIGVFVLSAVFSINKMTSIFGSQGRWYPSLVGLLTLVVFYYVVASNVKSTETVKKVLYALIAGSTLNAIITLMSYYGVYLGSQRYLAIKNFTPTGSTTSTAMLSAVAFLMGVIMYTHAKKPTIKVALGVSMVVNFFFVALMSLLPYWLVVVVGTLAIIFLLPIEKIKKERVSLLAIKGIFVGIIILVFFPATRTVIVSENYPKEIRLPAAASWIVASSAMRDFPILGTGPSTFYLNFPRYKPANLNNRNYWNVRFDKPYNEVFNIVGTLGVLGIVAAAYLGFKTVKYVMQTFDTNEVSQALAIGVVATMSVFLLTYATVLTSFVFFLLLGLTVANKNAALEESEGKAVYLTFAASTAVATSIGSVDANQGIFRVVISVPLFALAAFGVFYTYKMYPSEYYMRKAMAAAEQNNGNLTYQYQAKAINLNPRKDVYHNAYAQTNLTLARALAAKALTEEGLTDAEKETIQILLAQAIKSSRATTEILNPLHPANWEVRASVYKSLIGIADNADQWAIEALTAAIQLDPTSPRLRLDLGGIYYAKGDYLSAANMFRQATNLKPDYANAHYNFAQALINLQDYENAKRALEATQRLVPEGSADAERVAQEIKALEELPAVAGAQSNKPSVEELEEKAQKEEEETAEQEPLTNKGEETIQESTASEALVE